MNIGMLWFDNDPKASLTIKIQRAASYYRSKYGQDPTLCFVNPSTLATVAQPAEKDAPVVEAGVEVRSNRSVLPNHFWIGIRPSQP